MGHWEPKKYLDDHHPDVRVVEWELPPPLQGCVNHKRRIIYIATGLTPAAYRSTLAFEIGQLEQGPASSNPCLAAAQQRAAMEWAARMLISQEDFVMGFGGSFDLPTIAASLGVDTQTLRARIRGATDVEQDLAMLALESLQAAA